MIGQLWNHLNRFACLQTQPVAVGLLFFSENNNRQALLANVTSPISQQWSTATLQFAGIQKAVNKVRSMNLSSFLSKSVYYNWPLRDPMVRSKALWAHKCEGLLLIYSHRLGSRPSLNHTSVLETSKKRSLKIKRTFLKRLHFQLWYALTLWVTATRLLLNSE